jgi:hypothetical protein
MPRTPIPIPLGFYTSDSLPFSAQRCVGWIPTVAEGPALNTAKLMQPLGIKQFSDTLVPGGRGGLEFDGVPFFVNGNSLVSISSSGVITNHGTIPGSGRVSMANSTLHLVIVVPGSSAFVFTKSTSALSQITDPDFIVSDTVVFKDTFFVFTTSDGTRFFHSELNDPLDFNALDFGTSEINPDPIIAGHVNHNELFILNSETIELFQNIGGSGFVFQRIPGANIQKGCFARSSVVEFDNSFCFIGGGENEKAAVWKVAGSSSAVKISTDAIDSEIQKFTEDEIADSFAMTYAERGQFLALFTFKSERIPSRTFIYNATASALSGQKVWFEAQSGLSAEGNNWQVAAIVKAYGKLLVSDLTTGLIGELDKATLSYYGDPILRSATTQPFNQDGLPLFAGEFEATFENGVGLTTGQGSDPQVIYSYSDNGGREPFLGNTKRSIGKIGRFEQRSIWRRQGRFPVARTIRLIVTEPVVANLLKLAATPEVGTQ